MDLLYDIFKLNAPDWTDDFDQALTSTGKLCLLSYINELFQLLVCVLCLSEY